jgi:hypothetical protein
MESPRSNAPVIATILLLLPLLYVGSFYVLARPHERPDGWRIYEYPILQHLEKEAAYKLYWWLSTAYWPMERMDMALRPESCWP